MHKFNPPPLDSDQKIRKKQIFQAATSLLPYGVKINLKICTQNKFKKKNKRPKFFLSELDLDRLNEIQQQIASDAMFDDGISAAF